MSTTALLSTVGALGKNKRLSGGPFQDHCLPYSWVYCCLTSLPIDPPQPAAPVLLLYLINIPPSHPSHIFSIIFLLPFFFFFSYFFPYGSRISNNSIFSFQYSNVSSPFVLQAVSVGFMVLHLGLWFILRWFLKCHEVQVQVHHFACGQSAVPEPSAEDYSCPTVCSWHHCQKSIDYRCMGLALDFPLC